MFKGINPETGWTELFASRKAHHAHCEAVVHRRFVELGVLDIIKDAMNATPEEVAKVVVEERED